jgi:hypothetical protein
VLRCAGELNAFAISASLIEFINVNYMDKSN